MTFKNTKKNLSIFREKKLYKFGSIFGQKLGKKVIFWVFSKSAKTPVLACFGTFLPLKLDKIEFSSMVC